MLVHYFLLTDFLSNSVNFIISIISNSNYLGIFLLMIGSGTFLPFPSEIIMPFSGYLISTGKLNFVYVVIAGSCGNLVGATIVYYFSMQFGRRIILQYGKYFLLTEKHLQISEKFFKKYGDFSVFVSRMLPLVGGVISVPAGLAKMSLKKYVFYTFFGGLIWNLLLTYIGIQLGKNWHQILAYSNYLYLACIVFISILIIFYIKNRISLSRTF